MKNVAAAIALIFIVATPAIGQINSKSIGKIQEWVDSKQGRLKYKKHGEIILPKLTKSTKFGFLVFPEQTFDTGRRVYWQPVQSGQHVKMVQFRNWKEETRYKTLRTKDGKVQRIPYIVDVAGKYKTGEVHLIRETSVSDIRNELETTIYWAIRPYEYKPIGKVSDVLKKLRPPKSKEQRKEEERQRKLEKQKSRKAKQEAAAAKRAEREKEKAAEKESSPAENGGE